MTTYQDYIEKGEVGCGSSVAGTFFVTFLFLFTVITINLFIAALLAIYDEVYKGEEAAVDSFQLNDISRLWNEFDPEGTGYMH